MELGLALDDEDFIGETTEVEKTKPAAQSYRAKRHYPKWFQEDDGTNDVGKTKHAADYAYYTKDFATAISLYGVVLSQQDKNKSGGAGVRRDVLESLARSCLKIGRLEEAKKYAAELEASSCPGNCDHIVTNQDLLSAVCHAQNEPLNEIGHLASLTQSHPFVPDLWTRLATAYEQLGKDNELPFSSKFRPQVVAFALVRAGVLLRTVSRSVRSFAEKSNALRRDRIQKRLASLRLEQEELDRIELFASMDIFNRNLDNVSGESDELGKSVTAVGSERRSDHENGLDRIVAFEKQWFSFLDD